MKFLRLKIDNAFVIDSADISLDSRGLVLVTGYSEDDGGSNGSGKSSLTSRAITWALFGTTPEGERADDIINKNTGRKSASVEVEFKIEDITYRVTRQRNPSNLNLEVKNPNWWCSLNHRLESETQKLIEDIVGRSYNSFIQSDFFGQGDNAIPFTRLSPKDQRNVLESILPISQLDLWGKNAEESRKELQKTLSEKGVEKEKTEGLLEEVSKTYKDISVEQKNWRGIQKARIADLEKSLQNVSGEVDSFEENRSRIKSQRESLGDVELVDDLEEQISNTNGKEFVLKEQFQEVSDSISELMIRKSILESQIRIIEDKICPTCLQQVDESVTEKLKLEQEENKKSINKVNSQILTFEKKAKNITNQLDVIRNNLHILSNEKVLVDQRNQQRLGYDTQIKVLEKMTLSSYSELESQLKATESEADPFVENLSQLKERKIELFKEKMKTVGEISTLEKELKFVQVWEKAFKQDIKNSLFAKACSFLNKQIEKHLRGLNNEQFSVKFATLKELKSGEVREGLNFQCQSNNGGKTFSSLSSGEKQIVSFAIGLALSDLAKTQVSSQSNIMILDEPFTCLDQRNCENIVSYLTTDISKSRSTIFLVSNEDSLKALIPNRIHVIKRQGISQLEEA